METFKSAYEMAARNNRVEQFRSDEIAKEIAKTVDSNAQQALQTNMLNDLINGVPFSHLEEWNKYQAARERAKEVVDAKIANLKK
jgi:LPS O-antigen subunit length determinant protein (WzzB/FepE family)